METREPAIPLYQQLARRLWEGIARAGLEEGRRLPSVRTLASQHDVSLTTALQALRWLETQGHVQARPRSGYYVARRSKHTIKPSSAQWPEPLPELDPQARDQLLMVGEPCPVRLDLAVGEPALYPVDRFNAVLRRLAYQQPDLVGAHARGSGHPGLRREIVRQAMQNRCDLHVDELVVTNGCIEALNLALRAVTQAGDMVAVESPTYFVLLQMLRTLGLTPLPIPCHPEKGMNLVLLKAALENAPVKAVVTIANANNPVGSVAPDAEKKSLVELLEYKNIPLIEDDIFGDVCFGETRPRPARAFDTRGNVLLCGGYSKNLCPGLRLGWIAAGRYAERVKAMKYTTSMATAELQQAAVAQMLASSGYAAHLRRLRKDLERQHQKLRDAVQRYFPDQTEIGHPEGGFVLWIKLPEVNGNRVSTRELFEHARAEGIGFAPGHLFGVRGEYDDCLRLNAGLRWTNTLDAAVERLGMLTKAAARKVGNEN